MSYYTHHLFICLNERDDGKACCGSNRAVKASEMQVYAKALVKELGLAASVRVNKSGCLGRCALGPNLVIYPEGVWYRYDCAEDIAEIIREHLLEHRHVTRLLLPNLG